MNLSNLFEMQKALDERIVEEKVLQGQDLLDKKILALQVELGELANEWRGFKFWSEDQEPRTSGIKTKTVECSATGLRSTNATIKNPLLEEYVDCLHFILSIGLDNPRSCAWEWDYEPVILISNNINHQFINIFFSIKDFINEGDLEDVIKQFLGLGEMLGFTWDQIEQAYYSKNEINHARQSEGY